MSEHDSGVLQSLLTPNRDMQQLDTSLRALLRLETQRKAGLMPKILSCTLNLTRIEQHNCLHVNVG